MEENGMSESRPAMPGGPGEAYETRRRSQRVQISMPVVVRGLPGTAFFEEQTNTVAVNANGCLVLLKRPVTRAEQLFLVNPKTVEELPCRVAYIGQKDGGRTHVGLEFSEKSPLFWRITFPPEDWDPANRKRPDTTPANSPAIHKK
jgi:hypothetical protein